MIPHRIIVQKRLIRQKNKEKNRYALPLLRNLTRKCDFANNFTQLSMKIMHTIVIQTFANSTSTITDIFINIYVLKVYREEVYFKMWNCKQRQCNRKFRARQKSNQTSVCVNALA